MATEDVRPNESPTVRAPHGRRPMSGRDPHEPGRTATPLELLYDLSVVVAISTASNELAHAVTEDHVAAGLAGFGFSMFAIVWAWINYTWFASAFDNDDWLFRLQTMVQMGGVIVLALGIPDAFASLIENEHLDNRVLVGGYILMRISMVGLWLRAAAHDPEHRPAARAYVGSILISQALWTLLLIPDLSIEAWFVCASVLVAIELLGPIVAEVRFGGTPWHPHHIAERYGLLVIITLGETVIGTVAAISALVHDPEVGWTADAVIVLAAGVVLTLGMWWSYFVIPWGDLLHSHRERGFFWGYGHIAVFIAVAATGAGLHAAQFRLEDHSMLGTTATIATVAVPLAGFIAVLFLLYAVSMRAIDTFHLALLLGTGAALATAVIVASAGASLPLSLALVSLAPVVTIVGYETVGHRHAREHLERQRSGDR